MLIQLISVPHPDDPLTQAVPTPDLPMLWENAGTTGQPRKPSNHSVYNGFPVPRLSRQCEYFGKIATNWQSLAVRVPGWKACRASTVSAILLSDLGVKNGLN